MNETALNTATDIESCRKTNRQKRHNRKETGAYTMQNTMVMGRGVGKWPLMKRGKEEREKIA